jgi:hypothetical protein
MKVIYCERFIGSSICNFVVYIISLQGLLYHLSDNGKLMAGILVRCSCEFFLFDYCADSLSSAGSGYVY